MPEFSTARVVADMVAGKIVSTGDASRGNVGEVPAEAAPLAREPITEPLQEGEGEDL